MKRRRQAWIWIALAILVLGIVGAATDDNSDDRRRPASPKRGAGALPASAKRAAQRSLRDGA
jgi:hypothetical protein